jgi:hypothetical protein
MVLPQGCCSSAAADLRQQEGCRKAGKPERLENIGRGFGTKTNPLF